MSPDLNRPTRPDSLHSNKSARNPVQRTYLSPFVWIVLCILLLNFSAHASAQSLLRRWQGNGENSLRRHGDFSWGVSSEYGGDIRGMWDGILFKGAAVATSLPSISTAVSAVASITRSRSRYLRKEIPPTSVTRYATTAPEKNTSASRNSSFAADSFDLGCRAGRSCSHSPREEERVSPTRNIG